MSHFVGLVVNTDSDELYEFSEYKEVEPYLREIVTDKSKLFMSVHYLGQDWNKLKEKFTQSVGTEDEDAFLEWLKTAIGYSEEKFAELYEEHGDDWNSSAWKYNESTKQWEHWSTYNPKSTYDWCEKGGRWSNSLLTKNGEYVNECTKAELDFSPYKAEDYGEKTTNLLGEEYIPLKEDVPFRLCENQLPFCLVVNGEWFEKGKMGWFAMAENVMSEEDWRKIVIDKLNQLDDDDVIQVVDFHI